MLENQIILKGDDLDMENERKIIFDTENLPCTNCGNTSHERNAEFCKICGTKLVPNVCTNVECERDPNCRTVNTLFLRDFVNACPGDALFCPSCGAKTTFNTKGVIEKFKK